MFSSGKKIPREQKDPGIFDEAQSLLFKEILPYWAGFCKQYTQPTDEGKVKLPRKYSRSIALFTNIRSSRIFRSFRDIEEMLRHLVDLGKIFMAFCLDLCFPRYCRKKILTFMPETMLSSSVIYPLKMYAITISKALKQQFFQNDGCL